ncbi:MAG: sporulation integral membrane protein YlbJ [Thermanaeromonas sp.]|uniref:sporulation integral membrane protein YlbJ n=1 Tax=Thermanaeromonas sp. TaxID=2003697 RepID=UPI00243F5A42|nr:sporulation integral membrane protein YlbJ [Thermanaeromonas sp.]MCG0278106.1 sporulation integral membrane protein YlbJ [Thermanaeromonas sp.]
MAFRLTTLLTIIFTGCIILHPRQAFEAALAGLQAWWQIVVPALLPFFVLSQLLLRLGIIHLLGVLLEPVMRPLFNIPGVAGLIVVMGYASGAPLSASLTAQLKNQGLLSTAEGERLICFTNNASPLFMLGAVAVGMLQQPEVGPVIAAAHYGANLCLGLLFRFYRYSDTSSSVQTFPWYIRIRQAWKDLLYAPQQNSAPLGYLLGEAIRQSFQTLLTVGGFIIVFSVFIHMVQLLEWTTALSFLLTPLLHILNLDPQVAPALVAGCLEMTIGTKLASELPLPIPVRLAAISFILGWAGLSVHAQVASMISSANLRLWPFILARFFHGVLASQLVLLFYGPAEPVVKLLERPFSLPPSTWPTLWIYYTSFGLWIFFIFILIALLGIGAWSLVLQRYYRR